jgi:hypothetical protein
MPLDVSKRAGRGPEMSVPPINSFLKEVTKKQATPLPRQDLLTARNRF